MTLIRLKHLLIFGDVVWITVSPVRARSDSCYSALLQEGLYIHPVYVYILMYIRTFYSPWIKKLVKVTAGRAITHTNTKTLQVFLILSSLVTSGLLHAVDNKFMNHW
jgi:hypothetical protein